jgi:multicomponent Na+:H+ antiporter subunit C
MSVTLVLLAGVLVGTGVYLMLTRSLIRIVFGVGLLANGVNLVIIATSGPSGEPAFVGAESTTEPVPQAFVLTSIVISLALVAFLSALAWRSWTIDDKDVVEDDIEDRRLRRMRLESSITAEDVAESLAPDDHEWEARE